ncbi:hypothetical protein CHARACLAT_029223 [Characodon lateralis]|uniref:Uncharacterized protein n=1 Tax=Characodon lateralis TaxID=208331 RepID=A0ABU7ERH6_9TELE|nr:hypothetical protein [Characodon lateralis]
MEQQWYLPAPRSLQARVAAPDADKNPVPASRPFASASVWLYTGKDEEGYHTSPVKEIIPHQVLITFPRLEPRSVALCFRKIWTR